MEEYRQASEWIDDILDGKKKADNAPEMVQTWLRLTVYNLASQVAKKPTKQGRAQAMEEVKRMHPIFYDDVNTMARQIWSDHMSC